MSFQSLSMLEGVKAASLSAPSQSQLFQSLGMLEGVKVHKPHTSRHQIKFSILGMLEGVLKVRCKGG